MMENYVSSSLTACMSCTKGKMYFTSDSKMKKFWRNMTEWLGIEEKNITHVFSLPLKYLSCDGKLCFFLVNSVYGMCKGKMYFISESKMKNFWRNMTGWLWIEEKGWKHIFSLPIKYVSYAEKLCFFLINSVYVECKTKNLHYIQTERLKNFCLWNWYIGIF